jgi:hypothetical protein
LRAVNVTHRLENRAGKATLEQVEQRIAERECRPPAHASEDATPAKRRASAVTETHQVVPAVRTRTQYRVTHPQFAERYAQDTRREQRRIRPDDHGRGMLIEQRAKGLVETRPKPASPLRQNRKLRAGADL